jgi:hypothetical protein
VVGLSAVASPGTTSEYAPGPAPSGAAPPPERKRFTQDAIDRLLALTIADPAAMADPLQRPTAGPQVVSYDYHTDEQDSVRVVSNPSGAVVNEHDYDSFGRATVTVEGLRQPVPAQTCGRSSVFTSSTQ